MNRERGWRQDFVRRLPSAEGDEGVRILRGWERLRAGYLANRRRSILDCASRVRGSYPDAPVAIYSSVLRPLILPRTKGGARRRNRRPPGWIS